jgi:hypothetical protein
LQEQIPGAALSAIETMTHWLDSATVEDYLSQLDTLSTTINSQGSLEGSRLATRLLPPPYRLLLSTVEPN